MSDHSHHVHLKRRLLDKFHRRGDKVRLPEAIATAEELYRQDDIYWSEDEPPAFWGTIVYRVEGNELIYVKDRLDTSG